MKKLLLIFILSISIVGFSQEHNKERKFKQSREKIEAAKIGYLTNKLDLTSEQAQKFWPVYNEYSDKRFELKRSMMKDKADQASNKEETDKDWEKETGST